MENKKWPFKRWLRHPLFVGPAAVLCTLLVLAYLVCRTYALIAFAAYMGSQKAVSFMVEKAVAEKNEKNWIYWMGHFSTNPDDYPSDMMSPENRKIMDDLNRAREGL
jgi:hypothetical protein